jgi:hypothetical protein
MPSAVVRLIIERSSQTMSDGGFASVIENLKEPDKFKMHTLAAKVWVEQAIKLIRSAPGGETMGTDEQIAQKILDGIAERRKQQKATLAGKA